jgi:hypothetical protein
VFLANRWVFNAELPDASVAYFKLLGRFLARVNAI